MKTQGRLWKASLVAAVATIVLVAVVGRMDEWSKGLTDGFVVYGQSGNIPGGGGTGGGLTVIKAISDVVAGTLDGNVTQYSTLIQIANTSSSAVQFTAAFYENKQPSTLVLHTNIPGEGDFSATTPTLSLAANSTVAITATNTGSLRTLWGLVSSSAALTITTVFDQRRTADNVLVGRVGIPASDYDMRQFVIPRIRNATNGLDTGFALVNTNATTSANVTGTLRDSSGTVIATQSRLLAARESLTIFVPGFFSSTTLTDSAGTNHYVVTFDCGASTCAAAGLSVEGTTLSSLPVTRLQ